MEADVFVSAAAALLLVFLTPSSRAAERGDYHDGIHGLGSHTCGVPGQFIPPDTLNGVFDEMGRSVLCFVLPDQTLPLPRQVLSKYGHKG